MTDYSNTIQQHLDRIAKHARDLFGNGHVADYIPALAKVDPNQFGIAVCDLQGNVYQAGDTTTAFSIQSISKLFTLIQALQIYDEELWQRIGREPSGQRFNSLMQLEVEQGIPRNPFINAGALAVCDRLESRCSAPNYQLLELLRELSQNPHLLVNTTVARSELEHGSRNAAMSYLMKSYHNFDNPVEKVLESYAHHCAIEMNCIDLARAALLLCNKGKTLAGREILTQTQSKRVNALLATCGLYDAAGDFAYRVGLPGKSGVGGGIVAIYPGHYSICVWSPELNDAGNSLIGTYALEALTDALGLSVY
ncbi:glutaminase B [Pleionea mediterranea]|uniref:Glutaminase n=1 Tax=Pleionea mediterranea TaxID=523701 RepID=A0A316FFZ5_9GAMM|nr:glutaminase B [Pleionea mediterranea]PWK47349.1 L-glutaminase [Pleionea mediterranea]